MKTEKDLFELFCCKDDDFRKWMATPFINDDKLIATTANVLIFAKLNKERESYSKGEKDVTRVLNYIVNCDIKISASKLRDSLHFDLKDETKEEISTCDECDGEGEITCDECGYDHPCKKCDGDGKTILQVPTGNKIPDLKTMNLMNGVLFQAGFLQKYLCDAANIIGIDIIKWVCLQAGGTNFFQIGEYTILITPAPQNDLIKYHKIELL